MGKLPVVLGVVACAVFAGSAGAQEGAAPLHIPPSPLLQIDQQRQAVVDGIVKTWRETLAQRHGIAAADRETALRVSLMGLRADRLLAASLAGSYATVEALVAEGQAETSPAALRAMAKHLGEAGADLTYTPVNPCRILDTRVAGGALTANVVRQFVGFAANFTSQGGTASNCGMPNGVAAIAMNVYAVNPTNLGFIKVWAANGTEPVVSTVNYQVGITAIATGAIVPVEGSNNNAFKAKSPAGVDFIADVVGYFKAPGDATGLNILANGQRVMRLEYNAISPNVIGGSPANGVTAGVRGATIGGGGVPSGDTDPDLPEEAPNRVTDHYGTVGGGYNNRAGNDDATLTNAPWATVGGGGSNTASSSASTIGGGYNNLASGNSSTVSGGGNNTASGVVSTVAGGGNNTASGDFSFAAGYAANANQRGCFLYANWSDRGPAFCLGVPHVARFMVDHGLSVDYFSRRADGGGNRWVYMGDLFTGQTIATWTWAFLSDAGVWTNNSDQSLKSGFAAVDARAVLDSVVTLPITRWHYRHDGPAVEHIGPMAQDFKAAFGLGDTDKGIGTIDADGVALAAIQGLNAKLEEREAALRADVSAKDAEIVALKREVEGLRRAVELLLVRTSADPRVARGTP